MMVGSRDAMWSGSSCAQLVRDDLRYKSYSQHAISCSHPLRLARLTDRDLTSALRSRPPSTARSSRSTCISNETSFLRIPSFVNSSTPWILLEHRWVDQFELIRQRRRWSYARIAQQSLCAQCPPANEERGTKAHPAERPRELAPPSSPDDSPRI